MSDFHTQQLSNRQFSLLRECQVEGGLSLERVLLLSQTTSGSIVRRGFLRWDRGLQFFVLTAEGADLLTRFEHTDIARKAIDRPLSSFILGQNKELVSKSKAYLEHNHEVRRKQIKLNEARDQAMERAQERAKGRTKHKGE